MPIKRQRENILMTPLLRLLPLPALQSPPPSTCPLLFPLISLFSSSTCLFSQTAADCWRCRHAMSSDCALGWFGTLGPVVTSAVLPGNVSTVTGLSEAVGLVKEGKNTCLLPKWCCEGLRTCGTLQTT